MQATHRPAVETVHRLLFRALLEMRSQGHEQRNKLVFHLADLFHNVVLERENAAEGGVPTRMFSISWNGKHRKKGWRNG
jgi:hypothetical protein